MQAKMKVSLQFAVRIPFAVSIFFMQIWTYKKYKIIYNDFIICTSSMENIIKLNFQTYVRNCI
jgi:hypothetical protein